MSENFFPDELVTEDDLAKELKIRKAPHYEGSITHKRLPDYENRGWYEIRKNKSTSRIRLDKNLYELVEDELWSLFALLGFRELNKTREFQIPCKDGTIRKVDIFARDDETILICECTTADKTDSKRRLTQLIDKIKSYREDVIAAVHNHYGRDYKPKFGWIIATRNIRWSQSDRIRANEADIIVLTDSELDYYRELQRLIKTGARFQFLANVFSGKAIKGLKIKVAATKGKMGKNKFYTFLISPEHLLKIAYIGHKNSQGPEALITYQRMLKPKRLKDIANYINDGGLFPTNIVINLQYKRNLQFSKKEQIGDLVFGELTLPNSYATAWIIDGQHRLYGYAQSERANNSLVPVLAFEGLNAADQKDLFVDINHKQVKVPRGLLLDLYSDLHWGSDDPVESLTSLCSKITKVLGANVDSPLKGRIAIGEQKRSNIVCLTITTLANALISEQLVGNPDSRAGALLPGPLGDSELERALERATDFLSLYFGAFQESLADQWDLGDAKGGYICTNNAVVAQLKVLRAIFDVLDRVELIDIGSQNVEDLWLQTEKYLIPLLTWLKTLNADKFSSLRSKVGAKGQQAVAWEMQQVIYESNNEFTPRGLIEWMAAFDKVGTESVKSPIDEIQMNLYHFTIERLREGYKESKDSWWYDGVPEAVRKKCILRKEEERGRHENHQYLDLLDYRVIATSSTNWSKLFESHFSLGSTQGDKMKRTSWLHKLNDIRKTVSHPERGLLISDQVEFIHGLHATMRQHFGTSWKNG